MSRAEMALVMPDTQLWSKVNCVLLTGYVSIEEESFNLAGFYIFEFY